MSLEHPSAGHVEASLNDEVIDTPSSLTPDHVHEFPVGGLRAWLVVVGAFFGLFTSFGWGNCVGVFQAYYQAHQLQNESPSTVSWIPSVSMFMLFITGPFIGRIFDKNGPKSLLLVGTFLHVFGIMMASLATKYYQLLLSQAICSPLGAGMILYPSFSCVATWFQERRALAMGITASGSSLGGVVLPILINWMLPKVVFAWTMRTCAFMILTLLVITNLTVRSRLPPRPKPANIGNYIRHFGDPAFLLTVLASFCFFSMGMCIPITFLVTFGEAVGMSAKMAGYLAAIYNATRCAPLFKSNKIAYARKTFEEMNCQANFVKFSGVGRILPGYAADKLGNFTVSAFAAGLSTIVVFALWLPGHQPALAIAFSAVFGFTSSTYTAISPALVAQISDISEIGTRSGSLYAVMSIAALTGSPIGGALLANANESYWEMQILTGVMLVAGTLLYILARWYLAKGRLWVKI
ncbi:major facilitator superfamily domain-containing protein [Penicillium malachiteum]|nr:major facilitator superfamily domain-containing protein [Penicillium malachiteum]